MFVDDFSLLYCNYWTEKPIECGFRICQVSGNPKEQRNIKSINETIHFFRETMSPDNGKYSKCFHPVNPCLLMFLLCHNK